MANIPALQQIAAQFYREGNQRAGQAVLDYITREEAIQSSMEAARALYEECERSGHKWGPPAADGRDMGARCRHCGSPET